MSVLRIPIQPRAPAEPHEDRSGGGRGRAGGGGDNLRAVLLLGGSAIEDADDMTATLEEIDTVTSCITPDASSAVLDYASCQSRNGDTVEALFFRTSDSAKSHIDEGCELDTAFDDLGVSVLYYYEEGNTWYVSLRR